MLNNPHSDMSNAVRARGYEFLAQAQASARQLDLASAKIERERAQCARRDEETFPKQLCQAVQGQLGSRSRHKNTLAASTSSNGEENFGDKLFQVLQRQLSLLPCHKTTTTAASTSSNDQEENFGEALKQAVQRKLAPYQRQPQRKPTIDPLKFILSHPMG
jgi:hypothetical protein